MSRGFFRTVVLVAAALLSHAAAATELPWQSSWALFGKPKYAENFAHFDYVNPQAPKRGTLYLANPDQRSSFDKFNPYTIKGNAPAGLSLLMFETLGEQSADELQSVYGLLADRFQIATDLSFVNVHINPKAHFYNGDPVLAQDVKYSFDAMTGGKASPLFADPLAGLGSIKIVDPLTVHFELKVRKPDTLISLFVNLPVFSHKWGLKADGGQKDFDQLVNEYPITSGAYTIAKTDSGRRIEFALNPNYWARDLPVRRGFCNFNRVVYRYYQDGDITLEAFKAGEFDITVEYSATLWNRQYQGSHFDKGEIIKRRFDERMIGGYTSFVLNLRKPLFQDARVREALDYSFDSSETARRSYHMYTRINSLFWNSDFAATGLPSPGELELLQPYRNQVPQAVFGPAYTPPEFGERSERLRSNLLKARALLEQAGWKIAEDGVLRNAKGAPFEFEYLDGQGGGITEGMSGWVRNLKKLGITMNLRIVDFALYISRLESFDFDAIEIAQTSGSLPQGSALKTLYASEAADVKGSSNYMGVKDPVIDALIAKIDDAKTYEQLRDASRALDRVFMLNHYTVPDSSSVLENVAYWNKFGIPDIWPKYYFAVLPPDTPSPVKAWPVLTWWIKDSAAAH